MLYVKMEEEAEREEQGKAKLLVHYNIPPELLGSVSLSRRNLESAIMKLEPVITQLEEIWEIKVTDYFIRIVVKLLSFIIHFCSYDFCHI